MSVLASNPGWHLDPAVVVATGLVEAGAGDDVDDAFVVGSSVGSRSGVSLRVSDVAVDVFAAVTVVAGAGAVAFAALVVVGSGASSSRHHQAYAKDHVHACMHA